MCYCLSKLSQPGASFGQYCHLIYQMNLGIDEKGLLDYHESSSFITEDERSGYAAPHF